MQAACASAVPCRRPARLTSSPGEAYNGAMESALSPVYEVSNSYVERHARLDPVSASMRGLLGYDAELTDYSPDGIAARAALNRETLADLERLQAVPAGRERVALDFLGGNLRSGLALDEAGETLRAVAVIGSPFQAVRQAFDIMPVDTGEAWSNIARRLAAVPAALAGYRASLSEAVARGLPPARRQVLACATQGETWAGLRGEPGYFERLVARYAGADSALSRALGEAASSATGAYASLASWMREELAGRSSERDAAGRERYALFSQRVLGTKADFDEAYTWGWEELHRLEDEMARAAGEISPGASVAEVIALLETDPARALQGPEALQAFLQDLMDKTIDDLDGRQFDIPVPLQRVEAMIAPPGGTAAMYYTGPSEDFSRPGRTWYPTLGRTVFPIWGEVSICYHEGVPGHHLQIGQVRYLRDELSRFQRMAFAPGHGEGWALYAERLMDELGHFVNPEYRLGFLRSQVMRAARVVMDIGMHLELRIPAGESFHPGERWTPALGLEFGKLRSGFPADFITSELDRYLGWPAQATCYKLGEKAWLEARAEARRRQGEAFDLKAFHARALGLGPLLLDQLETEVAGATPA
jgi:uncharacterized protein (DUF885 family)